MKKSITFQLTLLGMAAALFTATAIVRLSSPEDFQPLATASSE